MRAGEPHLAWSRMAVASVLLIAALAPSGILSPPADAATAGPCGQVPRAPFRDVADSHVHAPGVDCLMWYEITSGVGFDRFAPDATLRRDEFAALVDRTLSALGHPLPRGGDARFGDVDGVHEEAIGRLAEAGIVSGTEPGVFAPRVPVQRDQMATILVRALRLVADQPPQVTPHTFSDLAGNPHEDAVSAAVSTGLLRGVDDTTFAPRRHSTRAQAATALAAFLAALAGDATALGTTGYEARVAPVPEDLRELMDGTTWEPSCPVGPDQLRLLRLVHHDLTGAQRWGSLVVHRTVVGDLVTAFGELHARGFPIARMQPAARFDGDDGVSMAANNTSAFNCRRVTGGSGWSEHSYGWAIDLNPVQNPYVRGGVVLPEQGRGHLERGELRPGMLTRPGTVEAFDAVGWGWGGDWASAKDYQHVSLTGR